MSVTAAAHSESRVPPAALNRALALGHLAIALYQFFLLPLVLLPADPRWALTLLPLAATSNPLWSLLHETIHDGFGLERAASRRWGRALAIAYGAPWRLVRIGHLLHHRFSRTPLDRPEAYDPARGGWGRAALGYYANLLFGLYAAQLLAPLAFALPRSVLDRARRRHLPAESYAGRAAAALLRPEALAELRRDGAAIYGLLGASLLCYGASWWLVPAILGARALGISFLDYIYHYDTRLDRLRHARNLRLPRPVAALLLNFNLHGVHHRYPALPWNALPDAFAAEAGSCDGGYLAAALRQLRGPVPLPALIAHGEARVTGESEKRNGAVMALR